MSEKLDIFKVLEKVDQQDIEYFDQLNDEEKKSIEPYMLMLWLSGTKSKTQIKLLNIFLNPVVFEFSNHKNLLYKLLIVASDGKKKRYNWNSRKKAHKYSTSTEIMKKYYNCSSKNAREYISLLGCDDIVELAEELGEQDDVIKKIRKEFK
jgi:hypothetical protein